jgi:hypothetical protein
MLPLFVVTFYFSLLIYLLLRKKIQIIAGLPRSLTRCPANIGHNLASKRLAEDYQASTDSLTISWPSNQWGQSAIFMATAAPS